MLWSAVSWTSIVRAAVAVDFARFAARGRVDANVADTRDDHCAELQQLARAGRGAVGPGHAAIDGVGAGRHQAQRKRRGLQQQQALALVGRGVERTHVGAQHAPPVGAAVAVGVGVPSPEGIVAVAVPAGRVAVAVAVLSAIGVAVLSPSEWCWIIVAVAVPAGRVGVARVALFGRRVGRRRGHRATVQRVVHAEDQLVDGHLAIVVERRTTRRT